MTDNPPFCLISMISLLFYHEPGNINVGVLDHPTELISDKAV
jgi:hypothetical protein